MGEIISVVIPARNAERFIADAVQSVGLATGDTYSVELIVVIDSATDDTAGVASRASEGLPMRTKVVHGDGRGASSARNIGVAQSTGKYLAFLDADDLFTPLTFAAQMSTLQQHAARVTFGGVVQFRDGGGVPPTAAELEKAVVHYGPAPGAMMVEREIFDQVGPFIVSEPLAEWVHWYGRLTDRGVTIQRTDAVTLWRRLHGSNLTASQPDGMLGYVRGFKTLLDERRLRASTAAPQ